MKFTVDYPIVNVGYDPALVTAAGMTRVAQAVEECGYDAISFSEHPAPSQKWLNAGGHESLDQTSALAFCAAVTSRVRLMTYLLVLPYHNPFLAAKALSTVDLLSGGRLTVVAGTGYLRSEFLALNVDMSAAQRALRRVARGAARRLERSPLHLPGQALHRARRGLPARPGPARRAAGADRRQQRPRPCPRRPQPGLEPADGEPGGGTDLAHARHRHRRRTGGPDQGGPRRGGAADGAAAPLTIQVHTPQAGFMQRPGSAEEHRDHLGQLADAGVDSFVLRPPGDSVDHAVEALHQYAETFLKG